MLLKYNIQNTKREKRSIGVENIQLKHKNNGYLLIVKTYTPHNLKIGDIILCTCNIPVFNTYMEVLDKLNDINHKIIYISSDKQYAKGYYKLNNDGIILLSDEESKIIESNYYAFNEKFEITSDNYGDYYFSIFINDYKEMYIDYVFDDMNGVARTLSKITNLYTKGDLFCIENNAEYSYKEKDIAVQNIDYLKIDFNPLNTTEYLGSDIVQFNETFYVWERKSSIVDCEYINDYYFKYAYEQENVVYISENEAYELKDTRFIVNGTLKYNFKMYEYSDTIQLFVPISNKNGIGINNENLSKLYFEEKKKELISDIVDYEKKCFFPVIKIEDENKFLKQITFNLFFRDRDGSEDWTSSDIKGWNQYKYNGTNFVKDKSLTNGDMLGNLNFTDDDVFYRKKKLSNSFLRLSFYDTNNPFKQMLLFYSTIFFDIDDLYQKYMKSINEEKPLVYNKKTNLTCSFTVKDKFEQYKSSEGFYLYLFPDGIEKTKSKTIYMKVEFNHAGYGKTIPLFFHEDKFGDDFPTSFLGDDNGTLKSFYESLYKPIKLEYDENLGDYVYYIDGIEENENNSIELNLFEPKLNPIE